MGGRLGPVLLLHPLRLLNKYHACGLKQHVFIWHISGGWESKVKVLQTWLLEGVLSLAETGPFSGLWSLSASSYKGPRPHDL